MVRLVSILLLLARLASASTATDLSGQLKHVTLDVDQCYRVTELNFAKEDIKIYLTSGYIIFTKPIGGIRPGAVFAATAEAGDAEVLLLPPVRSERLSLATFTQAPNLEEHISTVAFLFTDGTGDDLLAQIQANPAAKKSEEAGHLLAGQWSSTLHNLCESFETRLVYDLLTGDRKGGFFYMAASGNKLGSFDILHDPLTREQIFAGKLAYRDNRTYFDTWTSFPSRSVRNGEPVPGPRFTLDNFRIDSTIDPSLLLKGLTRMTLTPKRTLGPAIPFNISRQMKVTEARIDGEPAEVFERESLRSNLIASSDNDQFLLVASAPLDPARPHEIEIHHEGEVIRKAGDDVYYVTSRGTWYPRVGLEFANYDLTFRYPRNLVLVATGSPVEDRIDGDWRITRRKTEAPIRLAGFNLGNFQVDSITENVFKIDVYANRHLERALIPKTSNPAQFPPTFPSPRMRRAPETILSEANAPMPPPDPAARLNQLTKGVTDALEFMTAQFGPPPIRNLAVTPIPGGFGQGFPGLVYLSTLAYLDPSQRPSSLRQEVEQTFFSELLESHEVAHQWWGNMVVNAGYADEWLMESLANYSALLMLEKKKGTKAVDAVLDSYKAHLIAKTDDGKTMESAGPITWGYRLQSSLAPNAWRPVTYEKGTWIIHMLRRRLGDQRFMAFLREVATRYRFTPITTEQFRELAAGYTPPKSQDPTLKSFFENWVYGTGIPSVKLAYAMRGLKLTGTIAQRGVDDDFTALVPVEVQTGRLKAIHWIATGSEAVPFSIPLKAPPTRVALLASDCLMTAWK
ncbi:MAG TPA: M1 family aminopeptidase [Bryobacteraceae bacterium]|nr:M1 family aminopeptidase [Bryobacteraceae bacterium]